MEALQKAVLDIGEWLTLRAGRTASGIVGFRRPWTCLYALNHRESLDSAGPIEVKRKPVPLQARGAQRVPGS